ncbi:HtaA domain-containing protein [Conexibacter sp. JD483]|uniref:HtaA domain-containing protein n=1 Tax=unclassified Conexibacter TaxID=2627773 RepID=UPI00272521F6|nr:MULTISPECIES: HtaA domain-containing protein [unclassified Conexibacter]MDO8186857.1 HtaA domain-containing protein [Conexibacter sp. CPCC 205706]MDO8200831.1 HtaA domain-containing protein [Conexibacter sp. CPCC 205762]MDR9369967.1 HtaA domain-containing protein [Conexibacter sp. JD483]
MPPITRSFRSRAAAARRRLLAAVTLATATAAALAGAAAPAGATEHQIASGHLTWGIKESWRRYIGTGTTVDGGAQIDGWVGSGDTAYPTTFTFPVAAGTYDDVTRSTRLRLSGSVHFQSWCGLVEPGKCALDTRFSDLELTIDPVEQVLRGTHVGYSRSDPGGALHVDRDVVLATYDISGATTDFSGGQSSWTGLPTVAGPGFNIYAESTLVDTTSFAYSGPGGLPDLAEHWDTAGAPGLRAGAAWLGDADSAARALHPSTQQPVVHTVDLAGVGTSTARLVVAARDARTLDAVGAPFTWSFPAASASDEQLLRTAFDPATDTVFFVTSHDGATHDETTVRAATWNSASQSYDVSELGSLGAMPDVYRRVEGIVWNPVRAELAAVAWAPGGSDAYEQDALHRFTRDGAGWRHVQTPLRLPSGGAFAGATDVYSPLTTLSFKTADVTPLAVARDGSYVVAPANGMAVTSAGEQYYPALHLSVGGDGRATVAAIAGTTTPRTFLGLYFGFSSLTRAADGSLLLHNSDQVMDGYVRIDVSSGRASALGPIVDAPGDAFPPYEMSGFANSLAADPTNGITWATDTFTTEGFRLDAIGGDDRLIGRYRFDEFPAAGGDGAFGRLAIGPDSAVYLPIQQAGSGRLGYRRLAFTGFVPTVTTQPQDRTVTLGVGESEESTGFAIAVADGDDVIRWQAKRPGESRFADVAGATGTTLMVAARATSNGTRYRAVVGNAAGSVASDEALLTVDHAPALVTDVANRTVTEGADALFAVGAGGNPEPVVTWQRRVGGYWEAIAPDDDNFLVNGPSLVVKQTNVDQSGSLFRAKLVNSVATVYSRAATLTVTARATIPAGGLANVTLDWSGNDEIQRTPPFGGSNYLSAGVSDGSEATYASAAGNVQVFHVAADGAETLESWTGRAAHTRDGGSQLVRLYDGRATATAGGGATVVWDGDFSVNFYGGLVPFTISDPRLTVAADGTGTLTGDLSGYASTQADPTRRSPLAPVADVTIATFADVAIHPTGSVTVTPAWAGVEVALPGDQPAQVRDGDGWGAWPQAFVDFHTRTGLGSYWYTSGSAFDSFKAPHPFVVDFSGASAPPIEQPPVRRDPPQVDPPRVDPPVVPPPAPRAVVPGSVAGARGVRTIDGKRVVTVATLVCPRAAPCTVRAPRNVTVTIAGKRFALAVVAPKSIRAGRRGALRLRLSRAAARRLAGRTATVRLRVTIATGGRAVTRTVTVKIAARKAKARKR